MRPFRAFVPKVASPALSSAARNGLEQPQPDSLSGSPRRFVVDFPLAKRVREYTEMPLDRVVRSGAREWDGGLPRVLSIVVYNGGAPWTAAGRESDLAPLSSERMHRALAPLQPQAYGGWPDGAESVGPGGRLDYRMRRR